MSVGGLLAAVGPFFTFEGRVPPHELRRLSLEQIRDHLLWWEANRGPISFEKTSGRG
ncbi:hypothetical protein ACGFIG_09300 [Micromonospora sp. NPDC049048]|uniref:hypothetical protein n=1 Tax=Micromonospora sp. NPDC049048 TaxID=3364263 RepID=UPI0037178485